MDCDTDKAALERLVEKIRKKDDGHLTINSLEAHLLVEHSEGIELFYDVTILHAESGRDRPPWKDLRFLGSVQLKDLFVPYSELESLEGLDTTRLEYLNLRHNRITCIERLRGAKLRILTRRQNLGDNPIDPAVFDEIVGSWV